MNDNNIDQKSNEKGPGQGQKKVYRRAVFRLLDAKFQFKATLYCVMFILASHLLLYFIHSQNISTTTTGAAGKYGMHLESFLKEQQLSLMKTLGFGIFIICIGVGLAIFSLTKKVSGPLFNFSRACDEIIKGNLEKRVRLRNNDEFHWLADKFNAMMDSLGERFKKG